LAQFDDTSVIQPARHEQQSATIIGTVCAKLWRYTYEAHHLSTATNHGQPDAFLARLWAAQYLCTMQCGGMLTSLLALPIDRLRGRLVSWLDSWLISWLGSKWLGRQCGSTQRRQTFPFYKPCLLRSAISTHLLQPSLCQLHFQSCG